LPDPRRRLACALAGLVLLASPVHAADLACDGAIRAAEASLRLPRLLLSSIALVESGRPDPQTGRTQPWPWTINVAGKGYFFETKAQAIEATRQAQASGVQSIDVGCLQVNLMHHPSAFASLEQAFDPERNAAYAAGFLSRLFVQSGAWPAAAAAYHSLTPERAEPYRARVMAAWPLAARYGGTTPIIAHGPPSNPDQTREFRGRLAEQAADHALWVRMGLVPAPARLAAAAARRSRIAAR